MIAAIMAATLWLCTYVNNDNPPRVFSVTNTDENVAAGNAEETCFRYCMYHGCECESKGCKKWSTK